MKIDSGRHLRLPLALVCAAFAAACATSYGPSALKPGDSIAVARQQMGTPTAEYRLADGATRLEYARGPFGKETFMIDFDAQGRLLRSEQVLDDAHFNAIRAGMTNEEVLRRIGRPADVWAVRYHRQTVWSYRYDTPFCQLFHVGLTPAGVVDDTSYGPDPRCERRDTDRSL